MKVQQISALMGLLELSVKKGPQRLANRSESHTASTSEVEPTVFSSPEGASQESSGDARTRANEMTQFEQMVMCMSCGERERQVVVIDS